MLNRFGAPLLLLLALTVEVSAVIPAQAQTVVVTTFAPDANVVSNRLVFSTVLSEARPNKTLRIANTGTATLTLNSLTFGDSPDVVNAVSGREQDYQRAVDFQLVDPPSLPFNLAPGAFLDLNLAFLPLRTVTTSSTPNPTYSSNAESYASLSIGTNDPVNPTRSINLAGLNSFNYEGAAEPSLAEVVRPFGFGIDIGTEKSPVGGTKTLYGDELYSPYWRRVSSSPVLVWPLSRYSGRVDSPSGLTRYDIKAGQGTTSTGGNIYEYAGRANDDSPQGTEVAGSNDESGGENQKLLPKILPYENGVLQYTNTVPSSGTVDFKTSYLFALKNAAGGSSTDDAQNGPSQYHNFRVYPLRDATGRLVLNSYVAAEDNGTDPSGGKNFDYNDYIYVMTNVAPEDASVDPNVAGPSPGNSGTQLYFSSDMSGTLPDKDGQGTGFTSVQLNKNDGYTSTNSTDPSLVDLDLAGSGTLKLISTPGTSEGTTNTLVNGLQLAFKGTSSRFRILAKILGPINQINTQYQRAGIFFGPNQDNYIRLTASAGSNGSVGLQLAIEDRGTLTYIGGRINVPNPQTLTSMELNLICDPASGTVQAGYRLTYPTSDTGSITYFPDTITLTGSKYGHFFAPKSKAGIFSTNKGASAFTVVYDYFRVYPY